MTTKPKPGNAKKFIIAFVVQLLLLFMVLMYALLQHSQVRRLQRLAESSFHEADLQRKLADANAKEATTQAERVREVETNCQKLLKEKCR